MFDNKDLICVWFFCDHVVRPFIPRGVGISVFFDFLFKFEISLKYWVNEIYFKVRTVTLSSQKGVFLWNEWPLNWVMIICQLTSAWTETPESVTTYALRAIFKNEDFENLAQKHIICLNYHQNRLISKDLQTLKAATPNT